MSDQQRRRILDEVLVAAAGLLRQDPVSAWASLGPAEAFDRLQTAYEELVRGVFAYNRKWRPWRGRALRSLARLDYLPPAIADDLEGAVRTAGDGSTAYNARSRLLGLALDQLIDQLHHDDDYGPDAVSEPSGACTTNLAGPGTSPSGAATERSRASRTRHRNWLWCCSSLRAVTVS